MRPSIGVDHILVDDVGRSIELFGARYLARVYTHDERTAASHMTPSACAAYFAGRFAAKEAVFKAIRFPRPQKMAWTDIEIRPSELGWPEVWLHHDVRGWANEVGIDAVEVSISHEGPTAIAVAMAHHT
jgi:holo-[acyl-carrier protein] synthase